MGTYKNFIIQLKEMKSKNIGLMSELQYTNIGYLLSALEPINLLVFGLGGDAYLWQELNNKGKTFFLEDDQEWISKFDGKDLNIVKVDYTTFVGDHEKINFNSEILEMQLPENILKTKWDMIIVDAPLGHGPPGREYKGPGRMQSIYMAHKLLKENGICVVDDMKRMVEQKYALHYFGEENLINVIEGKVAIFKKKRNDSLKDLIRNKNVAIVGPAKYMEKSNYGKEIDNHDVVIRLNRGIESIKNYEKDIGKKTDIYYSCLIERAQQTGTLNPLELKEKYGIKHVVAPPESSMQGISKGTFFHSMVDINKVNEIKKLIPVSIIDYNFNNELAKKIKCKPNTGFISIYDVLRYQPKNLSIYGFSFYLDGFIKGQKLGIEKEKKCSEQDFADMAFNSKRHIQKNMWEYAKSTLLDKDNIKLDKTLEKILKMENFSRDSFKDLK